MLVFVGSILIVAIVVTVIAIAGGKKLNRPNGYTPTKSTIFIGNCSACNGVGFVVNSDDEIVTCKKCGGPKSLPPEQSCYSVIG